MHPAWAVIQQAFSTEDEGLGPLVRERIREKNIRQGLASVIGYLSTLSTCVGGDLAGGDSEISLKREEEAWENRDLVFPDLLGEYSNPGYLVRVFTKLLREADVPHMHFHDLRHSAATILLALGVNIKVIQELLGHSDIAITLRVYGHLLPSMQGQAVEKWEDVFKQGEQKVGELVQSDER